MNTLYNETGDSKYRPALLLKKMVRGGLLGVKPARVLRLFQEVKIFRRTGKWIFI